MLITIIIPTYNYGHYIGHAIQSVIDQNDEHVELIIVDDGSADNTKEVIETFYNKLPNRLRYFYQENRGAAAARNYGVKHAKGDYFLFLDADDRLLAAALQHLRQFAISHPTIDMICGGHLDINPVGKVRSRPFNRPLSTNKIKNFTGYLRGEFSLFNGAAIFHRRIFNKLSYPEKLQINEDVVLILQVLALYNCASIAEPVAVFHKHTNSLRHNFEYIKKDRLAVVDYLFNSNVLPAEFLYLRKEYIAQSYLSLFRTLYLKGNYSEARPFYYQAIKIYPNCLLKFSYLKKYLKSFVTARVLKKRG